MSILSSLNPMSLIGKGIDAISGYQQKKKEKEIIKVQAHAKLELAKQKGKTEITLKDAEWEAISVSKSDGTWKDEYVTLVVTWPLIGVLLGTMWQAFTGDDTILKGTLDGVKELKNLGMDFGLLMSMVVGAAISIKTVEAVRK